LERNGIIHRDIKARKFLLLYESCPQMHGMDSILLHGLQFVGRRHIKYSVSADGAIVAWKIDSSKGEELLIFYLFIYLKNCILCNVTWITALCTRICHNLAINLKDNICFINLKVNSNG
jgi:hypothetical protein